MLAFIFGIAIMPWMITITGLIISEMFLINEYDESVKENIEKSKSKENMKAKLKVIK